MEDKLEDEAGGGKRLLVRTLGTEGSVLSMSILSLLSLLSLPSRHPALFEIYENNLYSYCRYRSSEIEIAMMFRGCARPLQIHQI